MGVGIRTVFCLFIFDKCVGFIGCVVCGGLYPFYTILSGMCARVRACDHREMKVVVCAPVGTAGRSVEEVMALVREVMEREIEVAGAKVVEG